MARLRYRIQKRIRKRVIKGEYPWEVYFIWNALERSPSARTDFSAFHRSYREACGKNGVRPVVGHVLAAILRRESLAMPGVYPIGTKPVWCGLRVRTGSPRSVS